MLLNNRVGSVGPSLDNRAFQLLFVWPCIPGLHGPQATGPVNNIRKTQPQTQAIGFQAPASVTGNCVPTWERQHHGRRPVKGRKTEAKDLRDSTDPRCLRGNVAVQPPQEKERSVEARAPTGRT